MAIETICKGCARKLRVAEEFAGRKARCPHCKTIYTVPAAAAGLDDAPQPAGTSGDGWLLRTQDGSVYGPVSKSELDRWVQDGRLDATSQVRQEGNETWRQATEFYPGLLPFNKPRENPFGEQPTFTAPAIDTHASSRTAVRMGRRVAPHRGGMILAFGLLGLVFCPIFAIIAWVLGHLDMKEISAGRMDPEGRGLTQAGMIVGIIGTVLLILQTLMLFLMLLLVAAGGR